MSCGPLIQSRQQGIPPSKLDAHGLTQGAVNAKHESELRIVLSAEASLCDCLLPRAQAFWLNAVVRMHVGTMLPPGAEWMLSACCWMPLLTACDSALLMPLQTVSEHAVSG